MKKIYFVRHGETNYNIEKRVQGQKDSKLSPLGINQAKMVGQALSDIDFDKVYCSDLTRTRDTFKYINSNLNIEKVEYTSLLRERKMGAWEDLSQEDLQKNFKDDYILNLKEPMDVLINSAETFTDLKDRARDFLDSVDWEDQVILVVSHGLFLKVLILYILGIPIEHTKNLAMGNTGVSRIDFKSYNKVLVKYNDLSHLD